MWDWQDVKKAINESGGQFSAFLSKLPKSEIERFMYDGQHQHNVYGHFTGTNGDRARDIYDCIRMRALNGQY